MRPRSPTSASHAHYDDLGADVAFDVPAHDVAVDPPSDLAFDPIPDLTADAFQEALPEAKRPAKGRGRAKPPLAPPAFTPAPEPSPPGPAAPLSVCLSCGEAPPASGDCPHDEVAHLADASPAVLAVVRKLQAAVQERHAQERALRRLVSAEVSSGRGDIESAHRPLAAPAPGAAPEPCSRCGHRPAPARGARRRALAEAQGFFAFAAPPPPPAPVTEPEPEPAAPVTETAPEVPEAPSPRRRGRRRAADAQPATPDDAPLTA